MDRGQLDNLYAGQEFVAPVESDRSKYQLWVYTGPYTGPTNYDDLPFVMAEDRSGALRKVNTQDAFLVTRDDILEGSTVYAEFVFGWEKTWVKRRVGVNKVVVAHQDGRFQDSFFDKPLDLDSVRQPLDIAQRTRRQVKVSRLRRWMDNIFG